jgi:hypothetical protein
MTRGPTDARSKAVFPDVTLAGSWMLEPSIRAYIVFPLGPRAKAPAGRPITVGIGNLNRGTLA